MCLKAVAGMPAKTYPFSVCRNIHQIAPEWSRFKTLKRIGIIPAWFYFLSKGNFMQIDGCLYSFESQLHACSRACTLAAWGAHGWDMLEQSTCECGGGGGGGGNTAPAKGIPSPMALLSTAMR